MADVSTIPTMMTKELCLQEIKAMIPELNAWILHKAEYYLNCGALEVSDYEPGTVLPMIILTAVANEMAFQYRPKDPNHQRTVNNLDRF